MEAGFQELIDFPARPPRLLAWGARVIYVGPALGLKPHRNAVAVVALGLDTPFAVARDVTSSNSDDITCRSVLIPPNTLHHLTRTDGRMAFVYLDPYSDDLRHLQGRATLTTPRALFHLTDQEPLLSVLRELDDGLLTWSEARLALASVLGRSKRVADPRIRRALDVLHRDPSSRPSLEELADHVGLSASHFMRLFTATTGVPLRRYRLWLAMGAATRAMSEGTSLTRAAVDAGFSSSAHFSTSFRQMFGLEPSRLSRAGLDSTHHIAR
jgi:AraC-like DNA-binding protein